MQRSISTQTISFLRSAPRGSSTPIDLQPSSAMRAPSNWPAHMWPCSRSHSPKISSSDCTAGAFLFEAIYQTPNALDQFHRALLFLIRNVNLISPPQNLLRTLLNLRVIRAPHHHKEIDVDKLREAIALDQHSFRLHTRQRFANSRLDLIVGSNEPVNVCGARIPITASVFAECVS